MSLQHSKKKKINHDETFLITLDNLIYSDHQINKIKNFNVLFLDQRFENSKESIKDIYDKEAAKEYIDFLNNKKIKVKCLKKTDQLIDFCSEKKNYYFVIILVSVINLTKLKKYRRGMT